MHRRSPLLISVFASPLNRSKGVLTCGNLNFSCALGRSGTTLCKREGDGATPRALMRITSGFYRADRIRRPQTLIPITSLIAATKYLLAHDTYVRGRLRDSGFSPDEVSRFFQEKVSAFPR